MRLEFASGLDTWKCIVDFGEMRRDFLNHYGYFSAGIPSADTVARGVGLLNPKEFQSAFIDWMKDCYELTKGEVVAVDGKTVRGPYNKAKGHQAIHTVNVFATANGVCLAQSNVNEKTNEITEIPQIMEMLDIAGCLITIDAMGCQREITQKIEDKSADYLLAVKWNQGNLEQAFNDYYRPSMLSKFDGDSDSSQDQSHGRLETRCALVNEDLSVLGALEYKLPELKCMGILVNVRQDSEHATEDEVSVRYYISSKKLSAEELHNASKSHWLVESMYWQLDVGFREDKSRIRVKDRAEKLSRIRQACFNLLK